MRDVKAWLQREGYCGEKVEPECVKEAVDDLYKEFREECDDPEESEKCRQLFDRIATLERIRAFLEKVRRHD
jgi:hypothetical protein